MSGFRAVYQGRMEPSKGRFAVHVIGYKYEFNHLVNVPQGTPCTFIHIFHDEIDVGTVDGIQTLKPGTMIVFEPNKPLYLGTVLKPWHHSWVRCSGTMLPTIFSENNIPYHTPISFSSPVTNLKYLLDIHREMHHPKGADLGNVEDLFKIWMRNIKREKFEEKKNHIPSGFIKAKQYIELYYLKPLKLAEIAKYCSVSKTHLCKGFQKYYKKSPIDYAIELKLQYAIELMKEVDLNISQIAEKCGYSDIYYFSRLFKKHYGISPNRYRKSVDS